MNKLLLKLEVIIILVPITVISVPGLLYMNVVLLDGLSLHLYQNYPISFLRTMVYEILSLASLFALVSIWIVIIKNIKNDIPLTFSTYPYKYTAIIIGILISIAALIEHFLPGHQIKQYLNIKEHTSFLTMYILGLPVCIPAVHLILLGSKNIANNALNTEAEKAPRPLA